jgi:hypothetical protein
MDFICWSIPMQIGKQLSLTELNNSVTVTFVQVAY